MMKAFAAETSCSNLAVAMLSRSKAGVYIRPSVFLHVVMSLYDIINSMEDYGNRCTTLPEFEFKLDATVVIYALKYVILSLSILTMRVSMYTFNGRIK